MAANEGRWGASDGAEAMVIYLVRHGRTALNAAGALRGHIDVPLDEVGRDEAAAVAAVLVGRGPRSVTSSPLRRAVETADAVAWRAGLVTRVDDRLADRHYGEWAGTSVQEVVARWGSLDAAPGVEPAMEVRERALAALADLARDSSGAPWVVVSHDAPIRLALTAMGPSLGDPDSVPQRTGCFNTIECRQAADGSLSWQVLRVNEVSPNPATAPAKEEPWP
ncbi:MAG TPA: histidine phosphatase family protein [Acidimicrobiales bacterium]|nr:histidine phosphatase family protein [Acidimicrobiales bacterium]